MSCEAGLGGSESSNERSPLKHPEASHVDLERNGSGKHADSDGDGEQKNKAELLQQLKAIEEAIARRRSKLNN